MTTLVTTITETLRYRGKVGQWSWVLHRLTGLGTLLFLTLHIIDTSWAAFYPELYQDAIKVYQSPLYTIGEFGLVACVIYHAFNGLRIILLDYKPQWWKYQRQASNYVFLATTITLIPTFVLMFNHVLDYYGDSPDVIGLEAFVNLQVDFVLGFAVIIVAALLLSGVYGLLGGGRSRLRLPGRLESTMWSFMRISGVLIIPLVFGHLAMMHVIQGVFDITAQDITVIGTNAVNESGKAVEFVGARWDALVAGVAVWRVYDGLLLALVTVHGFNGLRYVVDDYATRPLLNRALNMVIWFGMIALIILGAAALLEGVDQTAYEIATKSLK
ncbi:MAG TPA: succinate dehydrogenase, cytochrome b556 subunit [Aggregatilineaceae bacterium]|nr:succinate dehydrogenase, cytochrome b556 subunit [Aggregatilineaceae bacterium]